jgi:hypothetical protein
MSGTTLSWPVRTRMTESQGKEFAGQAVLLGALRSKCNYRIPLLAVLALQGSTRNNIFGALPGLYRLRRPVCCAWCPPQMHG